MTALRHIVATVLMLIGAWYTAVYFASWLRIAFIPINNRLIYEGAAGVVIIHIWFALPLAIMAAVASTAIWLIESERRVLWLGVLTCLFLYSGVDRVKHVRTVGGTIEAEDRVGFVVEAVMPATACLVVGTYALSRRRRSSGISSSE